MLRVENFYGNLQVTINAIATPQGKIEASRIIEETGIDGTVFAKLASDKGDIRTTAAYLAVADREKSSTGYRGEVCKLTPGEILKNAYQAKAQKLEGKGQKDRAQVFRDQCKRMPWGK